jgi:prepilin-type N-terminal cleavage/methylation domain-containing protein
MINNCKQKGSQKAFTLIELLVVISIIAVLMSVLMPALGKAKEQATRIQCASQQKDIGVALNLYMENNKGKLPDSRKETDRWNLKMMPYYNRSTDQKSAMNNGQYDFNLFRCPKQWKYYNKKNLAPGESYGPVGMYGLNIYFSSFQGIQEYCWTKYSDAKDPSTLPLLACEAGKQPKNPITGADSTGGSNLRGLWPHWTAYDYNWDGGKLQRGEFDAYGPAPLHGGKCNYIMGDFSVDSKGIWPWEHHDGTDFHPKRNIKILPPKI